MAPWTQPDGMLPRQKWDRVRAAVPIACVDVLPVKRDAAGSVVAVGLIRRTMGDRSVWCHLGGRVLRGESLVDGAQRHVQTTIETSAPGSLATAPFYTAQFMPTPTPGFGFDPTKHAISSCYLLEFASTTTATPIEGSEALEFRWVSSAEVSTLELWPGTELIIDAVPSDRLDTTYSAVHAEYLSHNELMWQAPTLAMTAMAFLLTISLGTSEFWARGLAAVLSMVTAFASVQLLAKHSSMQLANANQLHDLERLMGMRPFHAPPAPASKARGFEAGLFFNGTATAGIYTLLGFGAVSSIALIVAMVQWILSAFA